MQGDTRQALESLIDERYGGDIALALDGIKTTLVDIAESRKGGETVKVNVSDKPVLLSTESLTKIYKRGRQSISVLDGISIKIHEGEFVAITGASGSGKSTLMNLMGGIDKPTGGSVVIGTTSLAKLSDKKLSLFRQKTVGFVFQFFYLQPFLRLQKNLEVPAMFARTSRKARQQKVQELAEKVGLADRLQHFPKELSGGQIQRAAIARALVNDPRIILADEPTGNLDSKNSHAIIELFKKIRDETGTAVVIITHDESIARQADRVIRLSDGRVV